LIGEEPGTSRDQARGSAPDFRAVYDAYYGPVLRYAARWLGDEDLAHDLAQETFVRFLESSVAAAEARPWLFRVITNLVRDERRRVHRRARLLARWLPARTATHSSAAEVSLAERAVRRALSELTDAERRILLLREEGLSYPETAAAAGISGASVGALLTRARKRFRECYERS
jgi:RNA polymerase sigma-70 factor (ECF subfamily)